MPTARSTSTTCATCWRPAPAARRSSALQAGNVNSGAVRRPAPRRREVVHRHGGWVHVDGAFGLWAAASPALRHLVDGVELADSWALRRPQVAQRPLRLRLRLRRPTRRARRRDVLHRRVPGRLGHRRAGRRSPLESSRRARGFAAWAALRELGRDGVADLVDRCCAAGPPVRRAAGRRRRRGGQRRGAEPGAGRLRRRRPDGTGDRGGAARRHLLDGRHQLARPRG